MDDGANVFGDGRSSSNGLASGVSRRLAVIRRGLTFSLDFSDSLSPSDGAWSGDFEADVGIEI